MTIPKIQQGMLKEVDGEATPFFRKFVSLVQGREVISYEKIKTIIFDLKDFEIETLPASEEEGLFFDDSSWWEFENDDGCLQMLFSIGLKNVKIVAPELVEAEEPDTKKQAKVSKTSKKSKDDGSVKTPTNKAADKVVLEQDSSDDFMKSARARTLRPHSGRSAPEKGKKS